MADRDRYVREFQNAAADFVSAQIGFTNAVIAARKAGISDRELAAISGMNQAEISQIPSASRDCARRLKGEVYRACRDSCSAERAG